MSLPAGITTDFQLTRMSFPTASMERRQNQPADTNRRGFQLAITTRGPDPGTGSTPILSLPTRSIFASASRTIFGSNGVSDIQSSRARRPSAARHCVHRSDHRYLRTRTWLGLRYELDSELRRTSFGPPLQPRTYRSYGHTLPARAPNANAGPSGRYPGT